MVSLSKRSRDEQFRGSTGTIWYQVCQTADAADAACDQHRPSGVRLGSADL